MNSTYNTGNLRVSTAEREPVLERLKEAYAEGRLEHEEFDLRMQLAMTAKTRSDLSAVLVDLPQPGRPALPAYDPPLAAAAGRERMVSAWGGPAPTGEDRMLAALAHGSGYVTSVVGPLVFMLLSGKRSAYVRAHAAEALNFQLTLLLVVIVTFGFGAILWAVTWIIAGIGAIIALTGQRFRYPFTLRAIRSGR